MKRLAVVLIIILIPAILWGVWWSGAIRPPSSVEDAKRFVITRGTSSTQIGQQLLEEGLIKNSLAFKIYTQISGTSKKIQSGQYIISPNLSLAEVVSLLLQGPQQVWVTVPEGLRREEIAQRFTEGLELTGAQKEIFISEFLEKSAGKEGFLFPDTYLFARDASASAVVAAMDSNFSRRLESEIGANLGGSGLSLDEIVILASLVERETITNEERPVVAGIILKRHEAGWPLQIDATVQYGVATAACGTRVESCTWWPRPLSSSDLKINSPYNTYRFPGFPPAPIANPGLSSIKAAVTSESSPYWYYIHDPSGKIHYARTLEEHNTNVARYLGK